jgi:hypothetical protein
MGYMLRLDKTCTSLVLVVTLKPYQKFKICYDLFYTLGGRDKSRTLEFAYEVIAGTVPNRKIWPL